MNALKKAGTSGSKRTAPFLLKPIKVWKLLGQSQRRTRPKRLKIAVADYVLLYPTARLWSVSQVSPEQHSKMLDLQIVHCSCPCTTTVLKVNWHLGQRCLVILLGFRWLSIPSNLVQINHVQIKTHVWSYRWMIPDYHEWKTSWINCLRQWFLWPEWRSVWYQYSNVWIGLMKVSTSQTNAWISWSKPASNEVKP